MMEIRSLGGRDHSGYYANARLVRRSRAELEDAGKQQEKAMTGAAGVVPLARRP
jgi:hypothetical protein